MQGIAMHPDTVEASGCERFFDPGCISSAAQKRLAGNSFNQACMTAYMSYIFSFIERASAGMEGDSPAAAGRETILRVIGSHSCQIFDSDSDSQQPTGNDRDGDGAEDGDRDDRNSSQAIAT